jgi:hypothetical protein
MSLKDSESALLVPETHPGGRPVTFLKAGLSLISIGLLYTSPNATSIADETKKEEQKRMRGRNFMLNMDI